MPTQSEIMQALARELINGRGADPGLSPPITTPADSRPFAVEQTPGTSWGQQGMPPGLSPAPMPAPPPGQQGMAPVPMPAGPIPPGRWR